MNNANEIVRALRDAAENCCGRSSVCTKAADLIESLQADLARVTADRDAAVKDIMCRDHCDVCVSSHEHDGECAKADYDCMTCKSATCLCRECRNESKWQWRGVKGDTRNEV